MNNVFFVLLLTVILGNGHLSAMRAPAPALNPKNYESPSRKFVLTVDPSDMYGRGEGDYTVKRDGSVVWSGKKPFTLYEAAITDEGIIGGYAYTHGLEGFSKQGPGAGEGEFHIVIMRPTGELVLNEVNKRTGSRFLHALPDPHAKGMLLDGAHDQLVIVVFDEDLNRRRDSWWTYSLSTGKLLSKSHSGPAIVSVSRTDEELKHTTNTSLQSFPERPLKQLGMFTLGEEGSASMTPIHDIVGFDFDANGCIGFIRRDGPERCAFVHIAADGKLLRETALAIPAALFKAYFPKAAWLEGSRWVVVASDHDVGGKASAWWFDVYDGKLAPVGSFDSPSISKIVGSRDGGFVALAVRRLKYTMEDVLIAFDKTGKVRWQIKQNNDGGETSLFSPEDIAVTTRGQIAVLDVIRHTVQFFGSKGNFVRLFKLEKLWGREPSYPSGIEADKDGGVLIQDFQGSPPFVHMDIGGKVVGEFQPRHPDGRLIDPVGGVKIAPSGHTWASDGECLVRLRQDGISDLVLGKGPAAEKLGKIAAVTVDQRGRLYAADDRTGAVHVFDETGTRLRVCKPQATDFKGKLVRAHVAASSNGNVYLSDGDNWPASARFIHFGPDGKRIGVKQFGLDTIKEAWFPLPASEQILVIGYHNAFLVEQNGKAKRTIERRPDRNWLETTRGASVAPDGSFAILTGGGYWSKLAWEVNLYTAVGDPVRTIKMPAQCMDFCFAYSGKYLATRTDTDVWLFKSTGEPLLKFAPLIEQFRNVRYQVWHCFATFEGRELWLVCPDRKSGWRYALP